MRLLSVTTGIKFGPWRMPHRAQQVLINAYLKNNAKFPDVIFTEGTFYRHFSRLRMVLDDEKEVTDLAFTSIFQIPESQSGVKIFQDFAENYNIHFALENICIDKGEGLDVILNELKTSRKLPAIDNYSIKYLFEQMKKRKYNGKNVNGTW